MIRTLKLKGFKSFADETEIRFTDGINCIVGPNGCGKSNVVDALKWVVGVTSAKGMRADTIKDVIFKGSEGRRPARSAEVSILIEQDDLFSGGSGLTEVRRRINSKGESEFLINGRKVRLKDVHQLFTSLGLGNRDYAFLEQGQIDRILRMRPSERKVLIDEAAGITAFKEKREETLRELEEAQQNLENVRGVIDEVAKNLRSLKSQAEKAKRFTELRKRERELELSLLGYQLKKVREERAKLEGSIKVLREDRSSLLKEVASLENSLEEERKELEDLTQQVKELSKELFEVEKSKKEASVKKDFLEREIERLVREIEDRRVEREEKVKRLEVIKGKLQDLCRLEESLLREVGEIEGEERKLRESLKEVEDKRRKIENEKLKKSREVSGVNAQITKLQMNLAREEERGSSQKRFLERLPSEIAQIEREIEYYSSQSDRIKGEIEKIKGEIESKRAELKERREEREEILERLNDFEEELSRRRREVYQLRAKVESTKKVLSSINVGKLEEKIIKSGKAGKVKGFIGPIVNLIEVEPGFEKVVESFLSRLGAGIVVKDFETAVWIGERIRGNGRIYILSASVKEIETPEVEGAVKLVDKVKPKDERVKKLLKSLFYKVYYAPSNAHRLAEENPDSIFVDENLNLISGKGSLVGKFGGSSLLELERKLKETESELKEKEGELKEFEGKGSSIRKELTEVEEEIELLKERIREKESQLYKLEVKLSENQKRLKEVKRKREELLEKRKKAEEILSSFSRKIELFKEKISQLEEKRKELLKELEGLEEELKGVEGRERELREELSKLSSRKGVLLEKLRNLREKKRGKEGALKAIRKEINHLDDRISKEERELEKAKEALKKAIEILSGVDEGIEEIRRELSEVENKRNGLLELIRGKEEALKQRNKELGEVSKRLKETEVSLAKLTVQEEELVKKVLDLDSSVSEALELGERVESEEEVKRELINLKERLGKIGAVNLLAIEEYEKVKERYGFILEQERDLIESIKNLKEALKKLDDEIEKRFISTFSAVNRHFKNTIKRIFGGGSGRLYLTSSEISEAGLEIEVRPPGKKHSNINLLSGGERTLVAIAFLYALYSVRPAPFLVLDEVDAALDDANTLRFTELLKQMAEETQVIIITHNKITMEAADVIYGVTMEVPGVSKVIGVSFEALV
ncbi:condensin subunit Smc [Thermovibrio guaymasensis]|uniref:Chromosome partition protein Smc n=1 Tax=Thermovibrio guaymasensis TaxID=240167 RepID=A0A420W5Z5_9BACT|nr:chromosome segregation protein SMC [Thermovibrio guaymasensis]RKQ60582.1 condensin subunit Smc [Thermovibrio guaymasensis]